tara:strand:- start:185 stop:550 length:366 start_codon:yes stop_codon:yes gene_type:complete
MEAVIKESVQELAEDVVKPVAKGGRMRVDTGFLRNSLHAAINSIPSGESVAPEGYNKTDFDMQPVILAINKLKAGDRLVLGFTAAHAKPREARDFFVRHSVQDWPQLVDKAIKKVSRAINQ